jgi:hypothetical protein
MMKGRLLFKVSNLKLKGKHLQRMHVRRETTGYKRCHMEKEGRKEGRKERTKEGRKEGRRVVGNEKGKKNVIRFSLFHRAFQFTIYNGPNNALVCNKILIQMSHTKTF